MNRINTAALAAAIGLALGTTAFDASAQDDAALRALVEQQAQMLEAQAAQLEQLNARLAAIEGGQTRPAATPAPAADAVDTDAQVAAAVADTRQDDLAILQAQVAQLAAGGGVGGGNTSWRKGGPEFRNSDRTFTFHPRGRVMMDFSSTNGSNFDARNIGGTEMRQVRLGAEGEIGALGYKIDAELADNSVSLKDAYLSWDTRFGGLPAEFYVGNKLKDRGLDSSTTLTRTPFMERNAVASVGSPASGYFGLGAQMKLIGQNWHYSLGFSGDDIGNAGAESDAQTWTTRAHWNPVKGAAGFAHLGGWYVHEDYGVDRVSINKVPRIASSFNDNIRVSASSISDVSHENAWGAELGGTWRNFWGFGEYTERTISSYTADDFTQKATSVYAGWLITGEKPGFSSRSGVWGTTRVARPVTDGGIGAWELAARFDRYDFTDAPRGGEGDAFTLGVNWYLNNWSRLMLDYVHWSTDNQVGAYKGHDSGNTINVRAQVAF